MLTSTLPMIQLTTNSAATAPRIAKGFLYFALGGVVVGYYEVSVAELVVDVDSCQSQGRAAEGVHKCIMQAGRVGHQWYGGLEVDIPRDVSECDSDIRGISLHSALGQNDSSDDSFVLNALAWFRAFKELDLEDVTAA